MRAVQATRVGKFTYYKRIDGALQQLGRDLLQL